jgi:uncharacterized protein (DUF1697 family)
VSGQKIIKMDALRGIFESMGFINVRTYIQSGNVLFEATGMDVSTLESQIEEGLLKTLGYRVSVLLRTREEIEEILKMNPFDESRNPATATKYLTLLKHDIMPPESLPLFSLLRDVEIIMIAGKNLFSYSLPSPKGGFGFPNVFIEKHFKISATTRNWNTITKMGLLV